MENSPKLRVLNGFRVFLRFSNAYNRDHFRQRDWLHIQRSISDAVLTTIMILIFSTHIIFDTWSMIEHLENIKKVLTLFPLIVSTVQLYLSGLVLVAKSHTIVVIIQRLQNVIDQRMLLFQLSLYSINVRFRRVSK